MRPLCNDNMLCPNLPHALTWQVRRSFAKMIGDTLSQGQEIMIHITKNCGPKQQLHLALLLIGLSSCQSSCCRLFVNADIGLAQKPAAKLILLISQNNAGTTPLPLAMPPLIRLPRRDKNVTMRMGFFVAVGITVIINHFARTCRVTDYVHSASTWPGHIKVL